MGCFGRVCESGGENFQLTAQTLERLGVKVVLKTMPTAATFSVRAGAPRLAFAFWRVFVKFKSPAARHHKRHEEAPEARLLFRVGRNAHRCLKTVGLPHP